MEKGTVEQFNDKFCFQAEFASLFLGIDSIQVAYMWGQNLAATAASGTDPSGTLSTLIQPVHLTEVIFFYSCLSLVVVYFSLKV